MFKIIKSSKDDGVTVIHARNLNEIRVVSWADFFKEFGAFINEDGLLIEQEWNENLVNGMVRCLCAVTKLQGSDTRKLMRFMN